MFIRDKFSFPEFLCPSVVPIRSHQEVLSENSGRSNFSLFSSRWLPEPMFSFFSTLNLFL